MKTRFCPHCSSERIHRVDEADGSHFHECDDCQEAWEHHEKNIVPVGLPSWHTKDKEVDTESDEFDKKIALRGNN